MGRRAKNKQADPEPLSEPGSKPANSNKKRGKRKADTTDGDRPVKKVKEGTSAKQAKSKPSKNTKGSTSSSKGLKPKAKAVQFEEAGSSEGWEDVEDGDNLQAETK